MVTGRPTGRPPGDIIHDPEEHIPAILAWVGAGKLLSRYCMQEGHPSWTLVYSWRDRIEGFAASLQEARERGYDHIAEDVLAIADGDDFKPMADPKLRVDARIRMLGRWSHRYSEKRQVEQTGTSTVQVLTGVPDPDESDLLL